MENLFRLEMNFFGIVTSIIVIHLFRRQIQIKEEEDKVFLTIAVLTLLELLLDSIFWCVDSRQMIFGREINLVTNLFYYLVQVFQSYVWALYCMIHMDHDTSKKERWFLTIPFLIGAFLMVLNMINGCVFTINESNVYYRTWGLWGTIEAICCLIYPLFAIFYTFVKMYRRKELRRDGKYLLLVSTVPIIGAVFQMLFYGLNFIWPGMALAILLIFVEIQNKQYQKMQNELTEQRIELMLSQIRPHFLYNSLSAIQVLCMQNQKQAADALEDFSKYLRANMDALNNQKKIPFFRELDHVKHYLNLEKIRFGEQLQIKYEITEMDFELPVLSLQPVVENAVKHGICAKEAGGTVIIRTERKDDWIRITVSDDGVGFDVSKLKQPEQKGDGRSHIGVSNVKARVEEMMNGTMTIESEPGMGTIVTMEIPAERA